MKRRRIIGCIGMMLCGLWAGNAAACFALVPLEMVVSNSPVVIVGEMIEIKSAKPKEGERAFDIAYIRVEKVLKNTLPNYPIKVGDKMPLSMPSAKNSMMATTDIRYPVKTKGIWILDLENQTFWATYPGDHQPAEKEEEIRDIIEQQAAPLKELDAGDKQTRKLEVRHSMMGYRDTLLFYTFKEEKAVLKLQVGNKDKTFPVRATIFFFDEKVTDAELDKWLNNQHSDGLYPEIPNPVHTYAIPEKVCKVTSHKLIDHSKQHFGEYDNYAVTLQVTNHSNQRSFKLKGFTVDTTVHVKTK